MKFKIEQKQIYQPSHTHLNLANDEQK